MQEKLTLNHKLTEITKAQESLQTTLLQMKQEKAILEQKSNDYVNKRVQMATLAVTQYNPPTPPVVQEPILPKEEKREPIDVTLENAKLEQQTMQRMLFSQLSREMASFERNKIRSFK